MNNPKMTLVLLLLIILAAMWTSGRLTKLAIAFGGNSKKGS